MRLRQSTVPRVLRFLSPLLALAILATPAHAQLGMTGPVEPPDEPCSIQFDPNLPTGLLPPTYRWAPAAFVENDPNNGGFTKPDEQNGRLHYFLRDMAGLAASPDTATNQSVLVEAVLLYLGLTKPAVGSGPVINADPKAVATAVAQIAVTGRRAFAHFTSWNAPLSAFSGPQDANLIQLVNKTNPNVNQVALQQAVRFVLEASYSALWAIRSNDPVWRAKRAQMGWIAVSGEDDTPHRPVNVPTAPYPQYDLPVTVSGASGPITATTRYMVASYLGFLGPDAPPYGFPPLPQASSSLNAGGKTLSSGAGVRVGTTVQNGLPGNLINSTQSLQPPRQLPVDGLPVIPAGNKIIIYIHGGGSRLEEAVPLANNLILAGMRTGSKYGIGNQDYTVISFDQPSSAYGAPLDPAMVYGSTYHPSMFHILSFEEQYVINFIEALDQKVGNVKNRVAAVMGGSLGGNLSLLLARESTLVHPYLKTVVAWSPTSMMPGHGAVDDGLIWNGIVGNASATNWGAEVPNTRHDYFHHLYFEMLSKVANLPSNPTMWFRDDWPNRDGTNTCKASEIAQSRFDRYEVYSSSLRRWTTAIDTEQAMYSFQDEDAPGYGPRYQSISSRLLLVAGQKDCYRNGCTGSSDARSALLADTLDIYGYTHDVANQMRGAPGRTLFINNTGHSIHDERPQFFAGEIVSFLKEPDTNLTLSVSVGSTGLRWNSSIAALSYLNNGGVGMLDLNAWWHPYPPVGVSPNNPCGACGALDHFELRGNQNYIFTWGLSRLGYGPADIQGFGINFFPGKRGGANVFDTPDSFALNGISITAVSGPAGTGQMVGASGQPLQLLTPSRAIWQTSQITQPQPALPALSAQACPTIDGITCSSPPKLPPGQETTTLLKAIVNVSRNGQPIVGASVRVDGGTSGSTDARGYAVVSYYLSAYSPQQDQALAGSATDPRGKPVLTRTLGNTSRTILTVPAATASKPGFQPANIRLPKPLSTSPVS